MEASPVRSALIDDNDISEFNRRRVGVERQILVPPARLRAAFEAKAQPLVLAGADVIIPSGVLPSLLLARQRGYKVAHAPVVNCASVALKAAEMAIALHRLEGLEPSRGASFALAPERAIADFRQFVAQGRQHD